VPGDGASATGVDPNRDGRWLSRHPSTASSSAWPAVAPLRMRRWCARRFCSWPMSTQSGATRLSPGRWAARIGRSANGGGGAGRGRLSRTRLGPGVHAFSPSAVRAQVTALACTLPRDSGKPLSRWSVTELVRAVVQRGIVRRISGATIQRWLRADRIKPWQYHSWQRPTDPRFLERAIPILTLYERAQTLARKGHVIVCADEKTSIQARQACGRTTPAHPGRPIHVPDRYQRRGAVQLFAGLLVHTGDTLARCFERKRFVEFQSFLQLLFGSPWCRRIRSLHLILDNGSTHAPKRLPAWLTSLNLPFPVHLHWLPVNASWLDQIEIVFSELQRKALTPNDFESTDHVRQRILGFFAERNRRPQPIRWTYTAQKLLDKARRQRRLAVTG
jgi:hypothetical protein